MGQFDPISMVFIFSGLALIPLMLMITTSFLKIAIVLVVVRNALGVQQVPPTMAIYGIALAITAYIMAPVFHEIKGQFDSIDVQATKTSELVTYLDKGSLPLKSFMKRHIDEEVTTTFIDTAQEIWPENLAKEANDNNLLILVPAFVISEIQAGFKIGFLVYLPFIVIDLLVSNLLLALGMQMVSPMTISMPLKILLFVVADGWGKLLHSLVLSYL